MEGGAVNPKYIGIGIFVVIILGILGLYIYTAVNSAMK